MMPTLLKNKCQGQKILLIYWCSALYMNQPDLLCHDIVHFYCSLDVQFFKAASIKMCRGFEICISEK